jgi:hypothetical protein
MMMMHHRMCEVEEKAAAANFSLCDMMRKK